ncbi:MAG: hypothetical protein M3O36_19315, partial [Myxococcota bacterium]|nr:hypothetical protein [Myxococcota bacterium]
VTLVDGGRGEAFVQVRQGGGFALAPAHLRFGDIAGRLAEVAPEGPLVVAGAVAEAIDWTALLTRVTFRAEPPHDVPRASAVGRLGIRFSPPSPSDADALEPLYVRPPEITMPKTRSGAVRDLSR